MDFLRSQPGFGFTRLHAHIVEEDGAFTVRVRMLNHLKQQPSCWGEEIAATFETASRTPASFDVAGLKSVSDRPPAYRTARRNPRTHRLHANAVLERGQREHLRRFIR